MIEGLRPYPAYVDSGLAWVGKVPAGWTTAPLGRRYMSELGKMLDTKRITGEHPLPYLRNADVQWNHIRTKDLPLMDIPPDELERYAVKNGDLLVCEGGEVGRAAIWRGTQGTHGFQKALHRLRPLDALRDTAEFMLWLLYCASNAGALRDGQESTIAHLTGEKLRALKFTFPTMDEQRTIVRFLGHLERRTQAYVAKRRRLIALLEEEKRALVERAVTRGLDPNVRLKDSGVTWLGKVPEGWQVTAFHFRYDQCLGRKVDAKKVTGQHLVPYLRNLDVRWDHINTHDLPLIDIRPDEYERFTVRKGDLLVCEGRHLGRCAFWDGSIEPCGFQMALHRVRVRDPAKDVPRFLFYLMRLAHERSAFDMGRLDNTIPHLTAEMLRAHRFPFPPVEEQRQIVEFLDARCAEVDAVVRRIRSELDLLQEYRGRLIADVVTGKVDVREAAASLPELDAEPVDTTVDAPEDDEEEELAEEEP